MQARRADCAADAAAAPSRPPAARAELKNVPVLFFANKMDLPTALSPVECVQQLELDKVDDKPWHIAPSNALSGEGIDDGITWLGDQMARQVRNRKG